MSSESESETMSGSTDAQVEVESATESTPVFSLCEEKEDGKSTDSSSKEPSTSEEFEVIEPSNSTSKDDVSHPQVADVTKA